jgi:phenylacetate-coenzyme A ligase PaaK-like adenylate-forming protein
LIRTLSYPRLSESRMEAVQRKKLRAVIRNAYNEVPYYRALFDPSFHRLRSQGG